MLFNQIPPEQIELNNVEQQSIVNKQQQSSDKSYKICLSLYLIQGFTLSIGQTMPYLYKQLPSYKILAIFSMIQFPFSLKFLLTPFMQKYTNMKYGKRKTWIVFSQILCSIFLFISSFFTDDITSASIFAFILMSGVFFLAIQDLSLDSLSIKQIKSAERASTLQTFAQPVGTVIGSLFLLKLTSIQFSQKIGLTGALTTPNIIIQIISLFLLSAAILMHFNFKQTSLQCQQRGNKKGFCQIITYANIFMNIKSRYSRTIIFIFIYNQGLKYYESGYEFQLIKAGFSRDNLNSISNLIVLPVMILTMYISSKTSTIGLKNILISCIIIQCLLYTCNITFLPLKPQIIIFTQFITQLCINLKNMMIYIMINGFPIHALTGMFITIMLSCWNISQNRTINTLLIDAFGWNICAYIGVIFQLFIIYILYTYIFQWVDKGNVQIDASIANDNKEYFNQNQTYQLKNYYIQPQQDILIKSINQQIVSFQQVS